MRPETYPWDVLEVSGDPSPPKGRDRVWVAVSEPGWRGCPGPHSTMVLGCGSGATPGVPQKTHVARAAPKNGRVRRRVTLSQFSPSPPPQSETQSAMWFVNCQASSGQVSSLFGLGGSPGPGTNLRELYIGALGSKPQPGLLHGPIASPVSLL